MLPIIGLVLVFGLVFGGFTLAGGKFALILKALPFELMMIGGGALGAFVVANDGATMKKVLGGFKLVMSGSRWKKQDYQDLLVLIFALSKLLKTKGLMALEPHIENPHESAIFSKFPKIAHDHFAIDLICDTLRMMSMNLEDPHQVENYIDRALEKHHHEALAPAEALQGMADGLPAIGIVAAVLGIIKTMGSIDQPPTVLGGMIGGALVGTFLGVFLAYCMIGPMASKMKSAIDGDGQFYACIKDALVAHLHGNAPQVTVEIARGNVPTLLQPSFKTMDEALSNMPPELAG